MEVRKLMWNESVLELKLELVKALNEFHCGHRLTRIRGLHRAYQAMQKLPEPTKENTSLPNTHILIDLRDLFFKYEDNPNRNSVYRTLWKFAIWIYELDAAYRDRIDFLLEKWLEISHRWVRRAPNRPRYSNWREFDEIRAQKIAEKQQLKLAHSVESKTVLATTEKCQCGGDIDIRYEVTPGIYGGVCFRCGRQHRLISDKFEMEVKAKCQN